MRAFYFVTIIKNCALMQNMNKLHIRQYNKSVLGDKVTPLTENTLLGRMMLYLNNNVNNVNEKALQMDGANMIENLVHGKTTGLRSLNVDQIVGLFYSANTSILSHSKQNLRKVLDFLDVECCLRINSMDPKNILKLLSAFMHIVPNRITEYKFYQYATDDIDRCLKFTTKKELLEFIFYIGLQKRTKNAQVVLRKCLRRINREYLNSLTTEDLCIICNSTYRTNTKISNVRLLEKMKQTLNDNLSLLKDPALLITLIKSIKYNHYQDDDLLSTISCTVFFNNTTQYYTFTAISHILSLYADYSYYDEELFKLFTERCIKQLQESGDIKSKTTHLSEQLRAKDITTFLWAIAILGYTEVDRKVFKDLIVPKIKERIAIGEYKNNPEELVDSVLYLWMLNYHAKELLPFALSQKNVTAIRENQSKNKIRLNLLLTTIEFENPQLFKDLKIKPGGNPSFNLNPQIQSRPSLQRLFKVLKGVAPSMEICQAEMNCQIPYLNIVGISAYKGSTNKAVNVEVLDEYNCVKNKDFHPTGLMQLKLRILEQLDVPLIVVQQDEIDSMTDVELREFLEDEIKLFC